jgi:hypothetical protein
MNEIRAEIGQMKKGPVAPSINILICLARPERFERPTPWFVAKYSIHLSYGRGEGELYQTLRETR